jgi:uncharacterized SAM-binding protein YcdF (DUF218 family)
MGAIVLLCTLWILGGAGRALVVGRAIQQPDALVMLASHEWERVPALADLARRYPTSRVLLTRPPTPTRFNCYRCDERMEWLAAEGIPRDRVRVLPRPVLNTHDEALAVLDEWRRAPFRRLEIVTSPYHTRRALAAFTAVLRPTGIIVGVVPATATSPSDPGWWWWHPYDRWYVAHEWAGILEYRIRYGVPILSQ